MPAGSLLCFTDVKKKNQVNGQKTLELYDHPCKKHLQLVSVKEGGSSARETPTGSPHLCHCRFEEGRGVGIKH